MRGERSGVRTKACQGAFTGEEPMQPAALSASYAEAGSLNSEGKEERMARMPPREGST